VGGVKCWGYNIYGQLGNGGTVGTLVPVDVSGLGSGVRAVAAGSLSSCAITTEGKVKCWGYNSDGRLGNGGTTDSSVPVDVSGSSGGVLTVSIGGGHTCALTTGGGVKCWGNNYYGQLGDGSTTNSNVPVDVSGLSNGVQAITVGGFHTCALMTGGGAKCWGRNNGGQLGNGESGMQTNQSLPVNVSGLSGTLRSIAAGSMHTCAVTSSGGAKCWGNNEYGQLGAGNTTASNVPVDVSGLVSGVQVISTGSAHACALMIDGAIKCWGLNEYGQIGNGQVGHLNGSTVPVDIHGQSSGMQAIAVGSSSNHSCALALGGGVKCWGWNVAGQLGDGGMTNSGVPVDVFGFGEAPPFDAAALNSESSYQKVLPGQSVRVQITVKNIGTTTWDGATYRWSGRGEWQDQSALLGASVAPSATLVVRDVTFNAPTQPGQYDYGFMLLNANGTEFGPYFFVRVTVTEPIATSTPTQTPSVTPTTPVPPTPPTPTPSTLDNTVDTGFRPSFHGAKFQNLMTTGGTWDLFKRSFPSSKMENSDGSRKEAAKSFFENTYRTSLQFGICFGLAEASLVRWAGLHVKETVEDDVLPAEVRSFRYISELEPPSLRYGSWVPVESGRFPSVDYVSIYQARQGSGQFMSQMTSIPLTFDDLKASLSNFRNKPFMLRLSGTTYPLGLGPTTGHAVVPYKLEDGDDTFRIFIYDPNYPMDDTRFIVVNKSTRSWTYSMNLLNTWRGEKTLQTRSAEDAFPASLPGVLNTSVSSFNESSAQLQLNVTGFVNGVLTSSSGGHISFDDGFVTNTLPGANYWIPTGFIPEVVTSTIPSVMLSIPAQDMLTLTISSATTAMFDVLVWNAGRSLSMTNGLVVSDSQARLIFTPQLTQIVANNIQVSNETDEMCVGRANDNYPDSSRKFVVCSSGTSNEHSLQLDIASDDSSIRVKSLASDQQVKLTVTQNGEGAGILETQEQLSANSEIIASVGTASDTDKPGGRTWQVVSPSKVYLPLLRRQ
jgi:alpha-tubulin suppressor-like RCC1 family protein